MLELPIYVYKDKVSRIRKILKEDFSDAKLKLLINHANFLKENISDLNINYKKYFETEIRDLLSEVENFVVRKQQELKEVIKRERLKKAMQRFSRWRINEMAENDEDIKEDIGKVLKTKANRVIATSLKTGEKITFINANQASKELGVSAGVISK